MQKAKRAALFSIFIATGCLAGNNRITGNRLSSSCVFWIRLLDRVSEEEESKAQLDEIIAKHGYVYAQEWLDHVNRRIKGLQREFDEEARKDD